MSRCLPFPPPGYKRNGACGEALIESIKLRREIWESKKEQKSEKKEQKKEKKKKRREEKEKRKEKRQKEGISKHADGCKGKDFEQYYKLEKIREEPGSGCLQKIEDEENELLERSGITEEHDQPLSPPELSDCNQSCNKRKRCSSPSCHDQRTVPGIVIRIRLSSKHNEPHESHRDDQLVSTSGTVETADCITPVINGSAQQLPNSNSLDSKELQSSKQQVACNTKHTDLVKNKSKRKEAAIYNSLFQNWAPMPLVFEGSDDEDWLFKSKLPEERRVSTRVKSVDFSQSLKPSMWPRAQWLPEAEIYALPYTVPF